MTSKTEQKIVAALAANGRYLGIGKRAFNAVRRMEAEGRLAGYRVSGCVFNANGPEFKSQWNHPRAVAAYEISVARIETEEERAAKLAKRARERAA